MLDKKTSNIRVLGIILFFMGAILAISSAAKLPEAGKEFPNTVGFFVFSLVLGIIGNILWHKTERKKVLAELDSHKNDEHLNPLLLLDKTVEAVRELNKNCSKFKGMALCEEVEKVLDNYLHPFVERRKTFQDILGISKGAEVLLVVAYAERMLNRVWSASSDGYPEEAIKCLQDSLDNFERALAKTK